MKNLFDFAAKCNIILRHKSKRGVIMTKFVPYEKMSKKAKKFYDRQKRNEWTVKPTQRVKESKKLYNRARQKTAGKGFSDDGLYIC